MNELKCPICGKPTRVWYGNARKDNLCAEHADQLKAGEIEFCEKCESWHGIGKPCNCKSVYTKLPTEGFAECVICHAKTNGYAFCRNCFQEYDNDELLNILNDKKTTPTETNLLPQEIESEKEPSPTENSHTITINSENKSKCITCGRKTDGVLFCGQCYHKYKNRQLLFRIKNCTDVELLDDSYEGKYDCDDGHVVKSKSEALIDNYLFSHNIKHTYETDFVYGSKKEDILKPDFTLPNYLGDGKDVYIEHWGYNENNITYTKTKKFKMPIYKINKITLVCIYESDISNLNSALTRKLNKEYIKLSEINFESPDD